MSNINDVTGDKLVSKHGNKKAFDDGWDRIFGKKTEQPDDSEKACECFHWGTCCGASPSEDDD